MRFNQLSQKRSSLRGTWQRGAAAVAASTLLMGAQATRAQEPALPLRGAAETLAALPPEAARMPALAPGRQMIVVTERSFIDDRITPAAVIAAVTPYLPAGALPLDDQQARGIVESILEDKAAAYRLTDRTGARVGCVVAMNSRLRSAREYAALLSGAPAGLLTGNVSGTAQQWQTAILFHEAAHCGQHHAPGNMFDLAPTLMAEIDADQVMTDLFEDALGGSYATVARDVRAMRALGAIHFTNDTHHTAAGVFLAGEDIGWAGAPPSGSQVLADMQRLRPLLSQEVGRMLSDRTDWYVVALRDELNRLERFVSVDARAQHPVLQRRASMLRHMERYGAEAFARRYGATQPALVRAVEASVGDQMRARRDDPAAYAYFATAARRLQQRHVFAPDTYGARFLEIYASAAEQYVVQPACRSARAQRVHLHCRLV